MPVHRILQSVRHGARWIPEAVLRGTRGALTSLGLLLAVPIRPRSGRAIALRHDLFCFLFVHPSTAPMFAFIWNIENMASLVSAYANAFNYFFLFSSTLEHGQSPFLCFIFDRCLCLSGTAYGRHQQELVCSQHPCKFLACQAKTHYTTATTM